MKADDSRLIPRKHTETLVLASVDAVNYDSRKCRMPATATQLRNLTKIAMVPKANIYEPW